MRSSSSTSISSAAKHRAAVSIERHNYHNEQTSLLLYYITPSGKNKQKKPLPSPINRTIAHVAHLILPHPGTMKFCFVATLAVLAGTARAAEGLKLSTDCKHVSVRCGTDNYNPPDGGLTLPMKAGEDVKDSCEMAGASDPPGDYRPMNSTDWNILQSHIDNYLTSNPIDDAALQNLFCRTDVNGVPFGSHLEAVVCYKYDGSSIMWKAGLSQTTMKSCEKTAEYFSSHVPYLGPNFACDPAKEAEHQCQPGYICAATVNGGNHKCKFDPSSDHHCCLSVNQNGCEPGKCCAGNYCHPSGVCKPGWEPKWVESKLTCDALQPVRVAQRRQLAEDQQVFNLGQGKECGEHRKCALGLQCEQDQNGLSLCQWKEPGAW